MSENKELAKEYEDSKKPNGKSGRTQSKSRRRKGGYKPSVQKKDKLDSITNDISWYSTDPALLRDAASFPFSRPAGTMPGYDFQYNETTQPGQDFHKYRGYAKQSIPGIMNLKVQPSVGLSLDPTSAVNVAAMSVYSFIRHANSGHANYDAPDLMMYLLAMSSVYSNINWMQRIYGTILMYSQRNRYIPRYLLESDGIDVDDLMANLANFRYGLNLLVNKASAFAVPSEFTLFNRHAFLFQNYYIEGDSVKDQIYYMSPTGFYMFDLDAQGKGMLKHHGLNRTITNKKTTAELLAFSNELLDALLSQEDFGIMSGDVLKAYGDKIIKLNSIDEVQNIQFNIDENVLYQIKNSTPVGITGLTMTSSDVFQTEDGVIKCKPYVTLGTGDNSIIDVFGRSKPITFDKQEVTPGDVIEGTRLTCALRQDPEVSTRWDIIHGSEIPIAATYFNIDFTGTEAHLNSYLANYLYKFNNVSDVIEWSEQMAICRVISSFKYHPGHTVTWPNNDNNNWQTPGMLLDLDNYTMLNADEISRLHDACLFNMLHVPAVAKNSIN